MYPECTTPVTRRGFLAESCSAAALLTAGLTPGTAKAAPGPTATDDPLPAIRLGAHRVTRLIAGYNPIGGYSHSTAKMSRIMREYFTAQRTADFLRHCETCGINTWQYDHTHKTLAAIRAAREKGCAIQLICLHAERPFDAPLPEVMKQAPLAVVHHGGVTDALFRTGKAETVHDFVKKVHDAGALAGVSSHCPANIERMAEQEWEVDLFMTCFYYLTRPREEMERDQGKVPVGEPFFESDPDEMTAVVRQVGKPCLGFKVLAAGRRCGNRPTLERAFQYAFSRIKPSDAVIVGMFPLFEDEVAVNAALVRKYG